MAPSLILAPAPQCGVDEGNNVTPSSSVSQHDHADSGMLRFINYKGPLLLPATLTIPLEARPHLTTPTLVPTMLISAIPAPLHPLSPLPSLHLVSKVLLDYFTTH